MRVLIATMLLIGCGGNSVQPKSATVAVAAPEAPAFVQVSKEGTSFNPPIEKAELPDGAYYCDMGTVHYARMEKGDGKCPACGMDLSHDSPEPAPEAKPPASEAPPTKDEAPKEQ